MLAVATPILAAAGAFVGHLLTRRSALELDTWRHREETMRMLRWSAELAISEGRSARLGVVVLESLADSELLQPADQPIVTGVLIAVTQPPVDEVVGEWASYTGVVEKRRWWPWRRR